MRGFSRFCISGAMACFATFAWADDGFFAGRAMQVIVSTEPGTVYDTYARLIARFLPHHIPGTPSFVVQNMPGGGGLKVANYMAHIAPHDGSVIAITHSAVLTMSMSVPDQAKFDERRFSWIGSVSRDPYIAIVWNNVPVKSFLDARTIPLSMGGASAGSLGVDMVALSNALFGTRLKLVAGYKDPGEIRLAMQRGEIDGTFSVSWSEVKQTNLLQEGKIRIIAQHGFTPSPEFGDAPMSLKEAHNEADRQALTYVLGRQEAARPFFAPAGVPVDRLAVLRDAFDATMKDQDFLDAAAAMQVAVDSPMNGMALSAFVDKLHTTPQAVIDRVRSILEAAR